MYAHHTKNSDDKTVTRLCASLNNFTLSSVKVPVYKCMMRPQQRMCMA